MTVIAFTCFTGPARIPSLILAWSFVDRGLFSARAVLMIQASWRSVPLRVGVARVYVQYLGNRLEKRGYAHSMVLHVN